MEEHLFRRESGRMVAVLVRIFGVHNLALAEDVVQDAFCRALEVWKARGVPENPSAWLMATAKNRALDVLRRERTARTYAPEMSTVNEAFAEETIRDEQLRMMFSCADPRLSEEVQLALILNILCGFSAGEIAGAFLAGRSAIEKRISRGKKVLATSEHLFDLEDVAFRSRIAVVRRALYLLFSEGYHGSSAESAVREDLCAEALRLTGLLLQYPPAGTPTTAALAALMCLHAARLSERIAGGDLHALFEQDRSRWDSRLIAEGLDLLEQASAGEEVSPYHIEAAIAAAHAAARTVEDTDWAAIVSLYDRLMEVAPSPVVALNRAIALGQRDDAQRGLEELEKIGDRERLAGYPFYSAAKGELELRRGDGEAARRHFEAALELSRNPAERRFLEKRLSRC
jgi:RNA polymerase sigma factor (sigma-70 family)